MNHKFKRRKNKITESKIIYREDRYDKGRQID